MIALLAQLPTPPVDKPVSSIGQTFMSIGVGAGLILIAVATVRLSRRWKTWTPALIPTSAFVAAFMEPLPDAIANLWYYEPGQVTLWTAFGVALPVWVFFSYVAFYGGFGLLFWWLAETGRTRAGYTRVMGGMWLFAITTELGGIQFGAYEYYGPAPFRVLDFPILPTSLINVAICASIGIGAARLRRWLPLRQRIAPAILLAPAAIVVGLIGCNYPVLNVIHTVEPNNLQLYGAATFALALTVAMAYTATLLVPEDGLAPIDGTPDPASAHRSNTRSQEPTNV